MLKKAYSKTKPVCKVTFTLPIEAAQNATEVRILGEFNSWSWENGFQMKAGKSDFTTEVELEAGKDYQFRYLIDNHIWENDWNADNYVQVQPFGIYNSVLSLQLPTANGKGTAEVTAAAKVETAKAKAPVAKTAPVAKAPAAKAVPVAKAPIAKAAPTAKVEAAPAAAKAPVAKAAAKPAAKAVVADDLTKIEGVGPKIAELLIKAGIVTFADLASAKLDTLKGILDSAGKRYQMHDPATWAEQAKLAAKADWAKLEKLQVALKGGKR